MFWLKNKRNKFNPDVCLEGCKQNVSPNGSQHCILQTLFWVSDKARLKPLSSAAETSFKIEISLVEILDMIIIYQIRNNNGTDQTGLHICPNAFSHVDAHITGVLYFVEKSKTFR